MRNKKKQGKKMAPPFYDCLKFLPHDKSIPADSKQLNI